MKRPWGQFNWVKDRLSVSDWSFIGCLSAEVRSIGALTYLSIEELNRVSFIEVTNPESIHNQKAEEKRLSNKTKVYDRYQLSDNIYTEINLFDSIGILKKYIEEKTLDSDSIILDITSFPKRFFFYILRLLIEDDSIKNLMVTYTSGESYRDGSLSFDPDTMDVLSGFLSTEDDKNGDIKIISGVGFQPIGLEHVIKSYNGEVTIDLIFPFPPGPPIYQRNWNFVKEVNDIFSLDTNNIHRVHALDVSDCFDHISSITQSGRHKVAFCPLGPKTHSLAMCIYAVKEGSEVYYAQPKSYHPDYTSGCKLTDSGKVDTKTYLLKSNGILLY